MPFQAVYEKQTYQVGFKLWVLADMTGYTMDFNIHTGKTTEKSDLGLAHDVVMQLVPPLTFQGYELYCDNFIPGRCCLKSFVSMVSWQQEHFVQADRKLPSKAVLLKDALSKVPRGTGYYILDEKTGMSIAYGRTLT